jgi:hypothetical protein
VAAGTTSTPTTPTLTLDGTPATNVSVTDNGNGTQTLTATVPDHAAGPVNVVLNNGFDPAVTLTYTYLDPYINLTSDSLDVAFKDNQGNTSITPTSSGTLAIGTNHLTVATNYPAGYTLSVTTNTNHNNFNHTSLPNTFIPANSGLNTSLELNKWGYTLDSSPFASNTWNSVPNNTGTGAILEETAGADETGTTTVVHYGAKIDLHQTAGSYQTTVVYTVVGKI